MPEHVAESVVILLENFLNFTVGKSGQTLSVFMFLMLLFAIRGRHMYACAFSRACTDKTDKEVASPDSCIKLQPFWLLFGLLLFRGRWCLSEFCPLLVR